MAKKWHISINGEAVICNANARPCPRGGADMHFDNLTDARRAADKINEEEHGLMPIVGNQTQDAPSPEFQPEIPEEEFSFEERYEELLTRGYPEPEDIEEFYILEKEREVEFLQGQYNRAKRFVRDGLEAEFAKLNKANEELREMKSPKITKSEIAEELYEHLQDVDNGLGVDAETGEIVDDFQEQVDDLIESYASRGYAVQDIDGDEELIKKLNKRLLK